MPIYKNWRARSRDAWYQLSGEEQDDLMRKVEGALVQAGGTTVVICRSTWSSEAWEWFGVEEFPDIEAVQKHSKLLDELNWLRYIDSEILLGTED